MYKSKSLFLITTVSGTLITMSSNNWISMWMGLELNMMSFIPLISKQENKESSESAMIYFLIQSMGSMILMFSILMMIMATNSFMTESFNMMITMSLMIKLGAAPFHSWLPEIMTKMSWMSCLMLLTWQKLAPLSMMSNVQMNQWTMIMASVMSTMIGAIGGLNQTSLRKLMGYSSINHLGWMISINTIQNNWLIYWIIYTTMTAMMFIMFNKMNIYFINQMNSVNMTWTEKINYMISMMSMGGLPPLLGFLPKWIVIQELMNNKMIMMVIIMIMMSMMTLFYYMRVMMSMIFQFSMINKWSYINSPINITSYFLIINLSMPMIMIINLI
uniref:NADH-ubiquinone oxidoreductase chain 2 n=1 Tax=Dalcantha cf. alata YW-2018 TaxID=2080380 RepID=A0A2K9YV12_9HEMI|nr:NADH dehydrogenase subunit 2 [Dalcantha dilatata]AUW38578.1 NADH dehydrogenase subunit 2 [Dalcantha cf. alata YW-2018]UCC45948.1 NADH dehydrogenase subunit 2 [Dalcantha dilatata]